MAPVKTAVLCVTARCVALLSAPVRTAVSRASTARPATLAAPTAYTESATGTQVLVPSAV